MDKEIIYFVIYFVTSIAVVFGITRWLERREERKRKKPD